MAEPYDLDDTRCDACGAPTPRLTPPADVELCDRCFRADANAAEIAAMNEQTYLSAVQRWFAETDQRTK